MIDLMNRIRTTTPADLENVRSDFDDDVTYTVTRKPDTDMVRIVKGADDLVPQGPRGTGGNSSEKQDWSDKPFTAPAPVLDDRGTPSVRQVEFIKSLVADLRDLDENLWRKAIDYNTRMDQNRAWDRSRGGNVSVWIDHLKAKLAELRKNPPVSVLPDGPLPVKLDKNGKPMHLRYAVGDAGPDDIKFYRIRQGRKPGFYFIDVQASDEFHPIMNAGHKRAIVATILAVGPEKAMRDYGRLIGECGRCGRTLTDAESRAKGIGPDCEGKM